MAKLQNTKKEIKEKVIVNCGGSYATIFDRCGNAYHNAMKELEKTGANISLTKKKKREIIQGLRFVPKLKR